MLKRLLPPAVFVVSRVRAGAFLNTLAPGPPSRHCIVTPFPYWLLFAFRLCKLLLNSPACELEVVGFDACTVAAHSAAYVLRPWDGFRLGRSALIWPSLSSGFCAVCDGVLDQPVGQRSAWDGFGSLFPCVGGIHPVERARLPQK